MPASPNIDTSHIERKEAQKKIQAFFKTQFTQSTKKSDVKSLDNSKHFREAKGNVEKLLKKRYDTDMRAYHESSLAYLLYQHPEWFNNSVGVISKQIVSFIKTYAKEVDALVAGKPELKKELYSKSRFGSLPSPKTSDEAKKPSSAIIAILSDQKPCLSQVMHIHATFFEQIQLDIAAKYAKPQEYKKLKERRDHLTKTIDDTHLMEPEVRGRVDIRKGAPELKREPSKLTRLGGIMKLFTFNSSEKGILDKGASTSRAVDHFVPDANSAFVREVIAEKIPFVAGPSGHTCVLLKGAQLFNVLTQEQLQEYALACFATLTVGGNHSFYEVMVIANIFGICSDPKSYSESIPDSIKEHTDFVWFAAHDFKGEPISYPEKPVFFRQPTSMIDEHNQSYLEDIKSLMKRSKK